MVGISDRIRETRGGGLDGSKRDFLPGRFARRAGCLIMNAEEFDLSSIDAGSVPGSETVRVGRRLIRLMSAGLILAGTLLLAGSVISGEFRDGHGALTGKFVIALSAGIGLIFLGCLVGTKWRSFAAWFSVALIGESAALQMIDAGRLIHFQHYRSFSDLLLFYSLEMALVIMQTLVVGYWISRHFREIWNWIRAKLKTWQLALALVFLAFAGAAVTPDAGIYIFSLVMGAWIQILSLGTVILMVWSVPESSLAWFNSRLTALLGESVDSVEKRPRVDRFAVVAAIWVVLLTSILSYFVYQAHPHVPDETQYLFQARYMAAGQLTVTAPPVPEAFGMYMVPYREARWFGVFSPGWPAVLVVGVWAGAEWLVNPALSGLCVLLSYLFFQHLYTRRTARIAIVLLCCSPWFIFMGMSFMGHILTLAAALAAAVIIMRSLALNRMWLCLVAGVMIGIVSLIRPLDGAIVAVLLGIMVLFGSTSWKQRVLTGAALVVGTILTAAIVLPYDRAVTGNAFVMPLDAYYSKYFWPKVMALGFGPERGMGWGLDAYPGHSPVEAVINTALNTSLLQAELFGWGLGSLLIAAIFLVSGSVRKRDAWACFSIAAIVGAYGLFWYHGGPDFGARYWFLSIIPLIALTVRGIEWLGNTDSLKNLKLRPINTRLTLAVLSLSFITLICYVPWRASDKYYHYLGMEPGIRRLSDAYHFGRSLVLVRGSEYPDYQSAWTFNPVNFDGNVPIYAFDRDPEVRSRLLQAFPDRRFWVVDGPSVTGGEYRVAAGPLTAVQMSTEMGK